MTPTREKRIKANILFVVGIAWISYFAVFNPVALSPTWMALGASALFGPAVINLWKGDKTDGE